MRSMRSLTKEYREILEIALGFNGVCWWLIDLKDDPGSYYCNSHMCDAFSLDPTLEAHSVRDTCPIAGDYLKNVELESSTDAERVFSDYRRLLKKEISEYSNEFPYLDPASGMTRYFLSRAKALKFDEDGEIELLFGIVEDISNFIEQKNLLEADRVRFKTLSEVDQLTKLYNRRHFDTLYHRECTRAIQEKTRLGVLFLDIDCFKQYNDTYGHSAGDQCLAHLSDALRHTLIEPTDTAFRYGGEEFVIICADSSIEALDLLCKRLCEAVRALRIPHESSLVAPYVTVSIGAAVGYIDALDCLPPTHLDKADEHLYLAKKSGSNCARTVDLDIVNPRHRLKLVS